MHKMSLQVGERVRLTGPRFRDGAIAGTVVRELAGIARVELDDGQGSALLYVALGGVRAVVQYAEHSVDVEAIEAAPDATDLEDESEAA